MSNFSRKRYYIELVREYVWHNLNDITIKELPTHLRRMLLAVVSLDIGDDLDDEDFDISDVVDDIIIDALLELNLQK